MIAALLTGIALGVASSVHCAAMCGPLALTIGRRLAAPSRQAQLRYALLHHAGRAGVYVALALPAGVAGEMLVIRGGGRVLAIVAGVVILLSAVKVAGTFGASHLSALVARASAPVLRWATARPFAGPLAAGALNGVLPCGLVYAALAAAVASGRVATAVSLMAGFAAGTSAVLIAMAIGTAAISPAARRRLRPAGPIVLAGTALVLLYRGVAPPHQHSSPGPAPPAVHAHR